MMLGGGVALMLLVALPAQAACPFNPETVRGSNGRDTLTGTRQRVTYFFGRGERDTFNVEQPNLFSFTGCTSRDYWDEIRDLHRGEAVNVPGTPRRYRIAGCLLQWQREGQTHDGWYFVVLSLCNLSKNDVVVR